MNVRRLLALLFLALVLPACGGSGSTAPPTTPPSGLGSVGGQTSGRIVLDWSDDSDDETGFTIERSLDGGSSWQIVGTVGVDEETFTDRGHHPLATPKYRVRPTNNPTGQSNVYSATLDALAWGSPVGSGPSARVGHSLIYDALNERLVLFGGVDLSGWLADVWVLDLSGPALGIWSPVTPTGTPPLGRYSHTAIYDVDGDRMIVFGGFVEPDPDPMAPPPIVGDVWALSLPAAAATPAWTQLSPIGAAPAARYDHTAVLDPLRRRMLVFGGYDGSSGLSDVGSLDLASVPPVWTNHGAAAFLRAEHCAVYDVHNDRMVITGGHDGSGISNSTWFATVPVLGVASWTELATPTPFARSWASAIYDEQNRRLIVYGGTSTGTSDAANDVWTLPMIGGAAWRQAAVGSPPAGRLQSSAAYDSARERMLVFSGLDGTLLATVDDQAHSLELGTLP